MSPKAKYWIVGVLSFLGGVVITVIGFVVLTIYVSFLKEKEYEGMATEEIQAAEAAEALEAAMADFPINEPFSLPALGSHRTEPMSPDAIEVGSWWTDGDVYFKVLSNSPDTLYMVGTNLKDCGMEITFVKRSDSTMVTDGASVYAFHNSPVLYERLRLADGQAVDFLVAFYDSDYYLPQAVLQRYHGRGLEHYRLLP